MKVSFAMIENVEKKINEYFNLKDVSKRNKILKELVFDYPKNAKDFFYKAFKKERYLDMKLTAVRGYAFYSSEDEVEILMSKLLDLLKKRPEHTPYNYQEYEIMRSKFLMPYLLEKYNYQCFKNFNKQLEKQYNDMPDVFKNIFSCDEFGNSYQIRDMKEVKESLKRFFDSNNG